jgi:hypothetical protein
MAKDKISSACCKGYSRGTDAELSPPNSDLTCSNNGSQVKIRGSESLREM